MIDYIKHIKTTTTAEAKINVCCLFLMFLGATNWDSTIEKDGTRCWASVAVRWRNYV